IMALADATPEQFSETVAEDSADAKRRQWREFSHKIKRFEKLGKSGLWQIAPDQIISVLEDYRNLSFDLARARSMGRSSAMVRHLNGIAVRAHSVLYRRILDWDRPSGISWVKRFPMAVRSHLPAVGFSALLLFGPAVVSFIAVQIHQELGY